MEFADADRAFFEEGGLLESLGDVARGTERFEAELGKVFEDFRKELPESLKDNVERPFFEDGTYKMKINGEEVDLNELKSDRVNGRFEEAYRKMGFDMDTPEARKFLEDQGENFRESNIGQVKEMNEIPNKVAEKMGPVPESQEEMIEQVQEKLGKGKEMEEATKDFDEAKKGGTQKMTEWISKNAGGLLKLGIGIAFLVVFMKEAKNLFDFINRVKDALSGCFAVTNSNTCKIYALTCDDDQARSGTMCTACRKTDCSDVGSKSDGVWIPLKVKEACTCDSTGKLEFPGAYCPDAPTGKNTCGGKNPNCPVKEGYDCGTAKTACENASGCISRKEACNGTPGATCSNWCSDQYVKTLPGMSLQCQKCNFWCAASHVVGNVVNDALNLGDSALDKVLGPLKKILIYIAIGIAVLVLGYLIIKEIIHYLL
jgi:hypothetical protein